MIVSQADIEFVTAGKCRRLLLLVERGELGERLPCPLEVGRCFKLQTGLFVKGVAATATEIVATTSREVHTAKISPGVGRGDQAVWSVGFVLGDRSDFYAKHRERYLKRKGVGLTDNPDLAVPGEPAVTTEEQLQLARLAGDRRRLEEAQQWRLAEQNLEAAIRQMRQVAGDREFESDLRFMERRLAKMRRRRAERAQVPSAA